MPDVGRTGAGWYRGAGVDRRWGEARNAVQPVPDDRRSGDDRRREKIRAREPVERAPGKNPDHWLHRVSNILTSEAKVATAAPTPLVTVREGIAASVYAAWEPAEDQSDERAIYREFKGQTFRQIGSTALSTAKADGDETVTDDDHAEFARAYEAIYGEYPNLVGESTERLGLVVVHDR